MISERLDGWRWQWGDFKDNADEVELFEQDKYESFAEAHADLAESIRKHFPVGSLQGDDAEGASNVESRGKRKPAKT
jgi:hypothetical protein